MTVLVSPDFEPECAESCKYASAFLIASSAAALSWDVLSSFTRSPAESKSYLKLKDDCTTANSQ